MKTQEKQVVIKKTISKKPSPVVKTKKNSVKSKEVKSPKIIVNTIRTVESKKVESKETPVVDDNHGHKTAKSYVVKLSNVSKKFGDFIAVNNVSFKVKKGEIVGLIGANGAGKTTITEMIVGLNKPTKGTIDYGFTYNKVPQEKLGMQFQDASYPSGISIKDIIRFAQRVHGLKMSNKELKNLLKVFQISDFYNKKPRSLSGGQRQKLNIFLSILHKPELIVLDELSTGLDISAREEIISFTKNLIKANNMSAIVISHHMGEIEELCDRLIVLDRGIIKLETTIKELTKKQSLSDYMRNLIKEARTEMDKTVEINPEGLNGE